MQEVGGEVGVALGDLAGGVAGEDLDGAQGSAGEDHVGAEGVAEHVVGDAFGDAEFFGGAVDELLQVGVGFSGLGVGPEVALVVNRLFLPGEVDVQARFDDGAQLTGDGDDALFLSFADDDEVAGFEVDLFAGDFVGVAQAHAGVIHDGDEGAAVVVWHGVDKSLDFVRCGHHDRRRLNHLSREELDFWGAAGVVDFRSCRPCAYG